MSPLRVILVLLAAASQAVGVEVFRFDDQLSEARLESLPRPDMPDPVSLQLGRNQEAWEADPDSGLELEDDAVLWSAPKGGTLTCPTLLSLPGASIETVRVRMRVTGASQVYLAWRSPGTGWDETHRRVTIPVVKPGEIYDYEIQVSGVKSWRHFTIDHVRLALLGSGTIQLQSITFVPATMRFAGSDAGIASYAIADEIRPCLFVHTPSTLSYEVDVPENAVFSAGAGVTESSQSAAFSLEVTSEGQTVTVGSISVTGDTQWHEFRADCRKFAGKRVILTLRASGSGGVALWSNPQLYASTDQSSPQWNVLLYVIDTLRADHLGLYGYGRDTAPFLTEFASDAAWFRSCYSQETWTKPSMATIFTGTDSFVHNIQGYGDLLPSVLAMWPETLRAAGYATCAISENPHTPPDSEQRRAFSYVHAPHLRVEKGEPKLKWNELPAVSRALAADFLESHRDQNFLLYMQTMECHDVPPHPEGHYIYDTPEPYRSQWLRKDADAFTQSIDLYDGGIRYADENLKNVIQTLKDLGLYENTVIIVTADHGESFHDHDNVIGHYGKPYNELIRVPLVIRIPGGLGRGAVIEENVQLMDLAPTIFDVLGLPANAQHLGHSLRPLLDGSSSDLFRDRSVYASWQNVTTGLVRSWKAWREEPEGVHQLFDLKHDAGEANPVERYGNSAVRSGMLSTLLQAMDAYVARNRALHEAYRARSETQTHVMKPTEIEILNNLQYLQNDDERVED